MDDNGMAKGLIIGFLAGAVIGGAVGILYAPKPGAETREMLKDQALEAKDKAMEVKDRVIEAKDKTIEMLDQVKERTRAMRHNKETA
jgi:gas vesicle protein